MVSWLQAEDRIRTCQRQGLCYSWCSTQAEFRVCSTVRGPMAATQRAHMDAVHVVGLCSCREMWAWGTLWPLEKECSVLGEALPPQGWLAANTTLRNNLGKEQRTSRIWHSWHPIQLSGVLRTHSALPLLTLRNLRQILQTVYVYCNMYTFSAHTFVVSKHYYSLFLANKEFEAQCV